jgi:glycosyltransferase involved in cell wall biosynthesis
VRIGINGRFYGASVTGVQRFAREVAKGIAGRVDAVLLLPRDVRDCDVPLSLPMPSLRGRLRGHMWEQLELPEMARRAACDVVLHLSGTLPARGGPNVAVLHDVLPLTHPHLFNPRFAAWYALLLRRAAPRAEAILTVSEQSRAAIARVLRPRRIEVVPQGLTPFDAPAPDCLVERVRAAFGLPPAFLLAVGRGDRRKNLGFLPSVLDAHRVRYGAPPPVIAVGNGVSRVHGRVELPVHPDIRPVGRVTDEELRALYSGAHVLLFPSIAEGFGRPPLEAAACGTPSLTAEEAHLPEPARRAGLPVPLQPAAWADAIASLLSDDNRRAGLVARGRAACDGLRWDVTAERVLEICADVARAAPAGSGRARERSAP